MNIQFTALAKYLSIATLALQCLFPKDAVSAPWVDPVLQSYLSTSSLSSQPIAVVAFMKNKVSAPRSLQGRASHEAIERNMIQNALQSQAETLTELKRANSALKYEQNWLSNALIAVVSAGQLKSLTTDENISILVANHVVTLIAPVQAQMPARRIAEPFTYGLKKLEIPELRTQYPTVDGRGVTVGILDTGFDKAHVELVGKLAAFKDFVNSKPDAYDDHGHGTHVAGTIAGGNSSGTAIGVAPAAKIISGKIFNSAGGGDMNTILKGMQWMADPDGNPSTNDFPSVVSNSWGIGVPSASQNPADVVLCNAVSGWVKLGILPVFSAGNSGPGNGTVKLPAGCPDAFSIGATDSNDVVANFSSRGPVAWKSGSFIKPDVSAPGVKVLSAKKGGGYVEMSGTSMAAPHVAGLAALFYQVNPTATTDDAKKAIIGGAFDLGQPGNDTVFGWGRIDAYKTLQKHLESHRFW